LAIAAWLAESRQSGIQSHDGKFTVGKIAHSRFLILGTLRFASMIRAVVQNGLIRPVDPIPPTWVEGHEVIVEDADFTSIEDLEAWYLELQKLGPAKYEPGESQRVQAILNEADEQAKAAVRREMGLP
jgi:hypothetical protein